MSDIDIVVCVLCLWFVVEGARVETCTVMYFCAPIMAIKADGRDCLAILNQI